MKIKVIAAICKNNGIGFNNHLPWPKFKTDMKFFSLITTGNNNNAIIMGKNTFNSLNNKPLRNRMNIVLTSSLEEKYEYNNLKFTNSLEAAINYCQNNNYDEIWIIEGSKLYESIFNREYNISEFYITFINKHYECDCFFPKIVNYFYKKTVISKVSENDVDLYFTRYYN